MWIVVEFIGKLSVWYWIKEVVKEGFFIEVGVDEILVEVIIELDVKVIEFLKLEVSFIESFIEV